MKYLKVKHYIEVLFKEGTEWEYKELLPSAETPTISPRAYSWRKRCILLVPSCAIFYFLKSGFSNDFMNYVMAALAIFIGLFTNLIIVLYQRYSTIPSTNAVTPTGNPEPSQALQNARRPPPSYLAMLNNKKMKNFIRQFTFVTGKNLLIATVVIVLISIFMLFKELASFNLFEYKFVRHLGEVNINSVLLFFKGSLAGVIRLIIIYSLIDFSVLLLYSLGALFAFLKGEYAQN